MTCVVSDHALIRWMERAYGIDCEAYREELKRQCNSFAEARARYAPVGAGLWAVFSDQKVITVTPQKPSHIASAKHDPGGTNGVKPGDRWHWKAYKRKRSHK